MNLFSDIDSVQKMNHEVHYKSIASVPKENANKQWEGSEPGAWEQNRSWLIHMKSESTFSLGLAGHKKWKGKTKDNQSSEK